MTEPREIEAKFEIDRDDCERVARLDAVGRFVVSERRTADQDDIYFDTTDARLAAAGATLRVRRLAAGGRLTFKGQRDATGTDDAHIASRLEDEVALDPAQVDAVSLDATLPEMDELSPVQRARAITGESALVPVARIENTRTTLLLTDDDRATLELALDDCVGTRLRDGRTIRFDEVEIETKTADRQR